MFLVDVESQVPLFPTDCLRHNLKSRLSVKVSIGLVTAESANRRILIRRSGVLLSGFAVARGIKVMVNSKNIKANIFVMCNSIKTLFESLLSCRCLLTSTRALYHVVMNNALIAMMNITMITCADI